MGYMDADELKTPPTELEIAELMAAAQKPDHQLSEAGLRVLRRLAFSHDRLLTLEASLLRTDESGMEDQRG
jgi:hypothetical protein